MKKVEAIIKPFKLEEVKDEAEDYHQKYLVKNPAGYTCHFTRDLKF